MLAHWKRTQDDDIPERVETNEFRFRVNLSKNLFYTN